MEIEKKDNSQTLLIYDELNEFQQSVLKVIIGYINKEYLDSVSLDADILSYGFDSLAFIKTVIELENTFGFEFDDEILVGNKFLNIRTIIEYVESKVK